jgi:hypothetical protein
MVAKISSSPSRLHRVLTLKYIMGPRYASVEGDILKARGVVVKLEQKSALALNLECLQVDK